MSKGNTWENDILELLLKATAIANVADNAAISPLTNIYISLHIGDVGEAGNQTTSECAYTSYARVAVARTGSGWTVTANAAENAAEIAFPTATGGSETASHFGVGSLTSGTGKIFYKGALVTSRAISSGVTPSFAAGDLDITED